MVRFSFSPTKDISVRELRVALLSALYAHKNGEQLIVRIEDRNGMVEGKEDAFLDTIALFGISYAQLYYQSNNFKYHLQFASTLLNRKKAFICFCPEDKASPYDGTCEHLSPEEVLNNPNPFVIRMKPSEAKNDSFIIMRRDKYPTPIFACACDDMLQGVTTIVREEVDSEEATKEAWVRHALGYEQSFHYIHVSSLQSDSDESSVQWLLDQGFMPEAIFNYLILLGNQTPTEIFSMQEALEWFDITRMSHNPAHFELDKLRSINREHIKCIPDMELSKRMGYACDNIGKLAKLYAQDASTTYEIKQKIDALFSQKAPLLAYEAESRLLQTLILKAPYFEHFEGFQAYLAEKSGLHGDAFFKPLHFWLTGDEQAPELASIYSLIKSYLKEIVR